MPALDSNDLDIIRTFPQSVIRHCSFAIRTPVFSGQVNGAPTLDTVSLGVVSFAFDNTTGSSGAIERDATIEFGTSAGGRDVGVSRVRKPVSGSTMFIAETALAALKIEDNIFFTVYDEIRPWVKLPRLVGVKNNSNLTTSFTEYHDYDIPYSTQNSQIIPIIIISRSATSRRSPEPAGKVDSGQIYRTVSLSAFFSIPAANAATIASYNWSTADCTITVGSVTSHTITLQAPIGFRNIKFTLVDSNGKSAVMYFPLWAHDNDTYPPYDNFEVTSDVRADGRTMGFQFFGQDNYLMDVYEGQVMCYWEEATNPPLDMPDDYISSFMGWATRDSEELKLYDRSTYRLEVGGTQFWLNKFNGYAQKLSAVAALGTVNRWYKFPFATLTVDRVTHYILREYTNILKLANLHWSGKTHNVAAEEWKKANIWQQITDLQAGNEQCQVVCDSLGAIWIRPKYEYLQVAARDDIDIIVNLDKQDWTDAQGLDVSYEYTDKVNIISASASFIQPSTNKNKLLFAKAPGLVPAQSGNDEEMPFQRLDNTTSTINKLCRLAGHHYAALNNPRGEVSLELAGNYDFAEIAWGEPVTLTWIEDSLRGTVVNTEEFIITNISVSHSNEKSTAPKIITWTLKQATVGEPGVQYFPPKSDGKTTMPSIKFPKINIPIYNPSDWINLPPSVPGLGLFIGGYGNLFGFENKEYLLISRNSDTDNPNWERVDLSLAGKGIAFAADYYSPLYLNAGTTVHSWFVTNTNIIRMIDLFGSRTAINQHTFANPAQSTLPFESNIVTQPCSPGFAAFTAYGIGITESIGVAYTTNGGTTWNITDIVATDPASAAGNPVKLWASMLIPGKLYLTFEDDTDGARLWQSLDFGATWTDLTAASVALSATFDGMLALPQPANPLSDNIIFVDATADTATRWNVLTEAFTSINLPDHAPIQSVIDYQVSPLNPNRVVCIMTGSGFRRIYTSRNGGAIWTPTTGHMLVPDKIILNNKNVDSFYVMGLEQDPDFILTQLEGALDYTRNFGLNYEIKTGDWTELTSPAVLYPIGWAGTL